MQNNLVLQAATLMLCSEALAGGDWQEARGDRPFQRRSPETSSLKECTKTILSTFHGFPHDPPLGIFKANKGEPKALSGVI